MIVGLLNDDYGQIIKKLIQQTKHPDLFLFKDYVTQEEMRAYYSMADAGIWLQAAISIQQAMGTGLPVFLRNKDSVNHLLTPGTNGMFVELNNPESSLELYLNDHIQKTEDQKYDQRKTIIDFNKKFDYKNILNGILKGN
jgi:glycosyltransferase involved in cell wall biosynthesis